MGDRECIGCISKTAGPLILVSKTVQRRRSLESRLEMHEKMCLFMYLSTRQIVGGTHKGVL